MIDITNDFHKHSLKHSKLKKRLRSAFYSKKYNEWLILKIQYKLYSNQVMKEILFNGPLESNAVLHDIGLLYYLDGDVIFDKIKMDEDKQRVIKEFANNIEYFHKLYKGHTLWYTFKGNFDLSSLPLVVNTPAFMAIETTV